MSRNFKLKKMRSVYIIVLLTVMVGSVYAQGDYKLQSKGNVSVTWRLVSDFQRDDATCWGWTFHIFVSNGYNYPIKLRENSAYQNNSDYSSCWRSGSVDLSNEVIPARNWREFTFRVTAAKNGTPGSPGLKYNIDWVAK